MEDTDARDTPRRIARSAQGDERGVSKDARQVWDRRKGELLISLSGEPRGVLGAAAVAAAAATGSPGARSKDARG